jgi:hypothetical protein
VCRTGGWLGNVFGKCVCSNMPGWTVELWWRVQSDGSNVFVGGYRWLCCHRHGGVFWNHHNVQCNAQNIGYMYGTRGRYLRRGRCL